MKTKNTIYYLYAESDSFIWGGSETNPDDRTFTIDDKNYRFSKENANKRYGIIIVKYYCNNEI